MVGRPVLLFRPGRLRSAQGGGQLLRDCPTVCRWQPGSVNEHMSAQIQSLADERPLALVVDDSKVIRVALSRLLAPHFEVLAAADGSEALELLEANPKVALLFTDLLMPELDGFGLMRRLRESGDARLRSLPVVVITGADQDDSLRRRAEEAGAAAFVSKPFCSEEIRRLADRWGLASRKSAEPAEEPAREETAAAQPARDYVSELNRLQRQLEESAAELEAARHAQLLTEKRAERFKMDLLRYQKNTQAHIRELERERETLRERVVELEESVRDGAEARRAEELEARIRELEEELAGSSEELLDLSLALEEEKKARDRAEEEAAIYRIKLEVVRRKIEEGKRRRQMGSPPEGQAPSDAHRGGLLSRLFRWRKG